MLQARKKAHKKKEKKEKRGKKEKRHRRDYSEEEGQIHEGMRWTQQLFSCHVLSKKH